MSKLDVTIIGAGRVGLPLALALEETGLNVGVKDLNPAVIEALETGVMPFHEPGFDGLISNTNIKADLVNIPEATAYVITVGTPLKQHIETDLHYVTDVIDELIDESKVKDSLIVLRSTVAPGTTQYVKDHIEQRTGYKVGEDYKLAMCPERIAEGLAREELSSLPQIIGTFDESSYTAASNIFSNLVGTNIRKATPPEAELAKLFCNIYRYINFAIPNYFVYLADQFGVEPFRLMDVMNIGYDRNKGLKKPGFAAGTCVRGNRSLNLNDCDFKSRGVVTYKSFYKFFHANKEKEFFTVPSFDYKLNVSNDKKILDVTKTVYTGDMYTFKLANNKSFECTAYHLIPVKKNNGIIIKKAKDIKTTDVLYIYN